MEFDINWLIKIARAAHAHHKAHHRIEVTVTQRTDDLGIRLAVDLQAAIPDDALIFARISGAWLGNLAAVDDVLYRDADGSFLTIGPVVGQRAALYIPYGAASNRGPGLYNLDMSIQLLGSNPEKPTEVAHATIKLALPEQRPWRRLAFFLPLVQLCMAVIRVDDEILPIEIRGLKSLLGDGIPLSAQDLSDLRHLMKAPTPSDLAGPLQSLMLRLPMLTPQSTLELLTEVARLDGAVNVHEYAVLSHIAALLGFPTARHAALIAPPTARPLAPVRTT